MTSTELQERLRQLTSLPTLPEIASRLIKMINDPFSSTNDISYLIGQDPSLSAKVLRLANSAFYGMPGRISNINHAVVLLGFKVITTIILSVTVFDMFPEKKEPRHLFNRKAFWTHSIACGAIAKLLALHIKKRLLFDPEEAFCAGLLHDLGKIVMEQYLHTEFHQAMLMAKSGKIPLHSAEKKVMGYTHTDVAQWLTSGWNLPPQINLPIIYHHSPHLAGDTYPIIGLIHVADWLCYENEMTIDSMFQRPEVDKEILKTLKIGDEDIETVRAALPAELERISMFYSAAVAA